jgi:hypothetical protein
MPKIILEFDGFEEAKEARIAMDAQKWKSVVWDLDQELRTVTKYGASLINRNEEASKEETEMAERLRIKLRELLSDEGLIME